jgi:glucose-6-phosphate-specific signal transduction histidine kinase
VSHGALAQDKAGWTDQIKRQKVQQCTDRAVAKSVPLYKAALKGKLDDLEYQAFIQSISQEMSETCHCLISHIATEYDHQQFENETQAVTHYAESLSRDGQPCAPDMEAMVQRMSVTLSARQ